MWSDIAFVDNQECLDLIEGKVPPGRQPLMPLLAYLRPLSRAASFRARAFRFIFCDVTCRRACRRTVAAA